MNTSQDIQMLMVDDNIGNRFTQTAGMSVGIQSGQIAVQNVGNMDRISVVTGLQTKDTLQQASTSGTQSDKAPIYDSDGSTENDSNIISMASSVEQGGGTVEQHSATIKETRAYQESLLLNLVAEVEKVNMQAQQKQQSLYNGKVLLEKHDPPVVHDSEETLQLAQESRLKMKQLNKEIKLANYTKINHLSGVFVSQMAKSREESYFINTFKTATVSKLISIPNEEFSNDATPSVARKFLNEVKRTIVTLQRVFKHKMTLETHNWSSTAHQEIHKILKDEIFPIVNQFLKYNFEIQFLKEVAKFIRDFQSLANEADESLDKQKKMEREIDCLLRAVNDWHTKCEECKYDKILYDKAYNDMKQMIEWLQAQLGDLKGKNKDTSCASDTLDPLSQKLENENVELEFQVQNYGKEIAHLKTTYKNLFDSISVTRAQNKTLTDSLQTQLQDFIYENAKLRAKLSDKTSLLRPEGHSLGAIQRMIGSPSASKNSCLKNKEVEVEEHHRNLLLSKNKKHMSSECNNVKLVIRNDKSEVVCAMWAPRYPKNDPEDIGKHVTKVTWLSLVIPLILGLQSFDNQRTKKIMETINVTFDELSAMAFEQRSSKPSLKA
ncbi:hypothetical protein Tco_0339233 [Tanacetum coccineum]